MRVLGIETSTITCGAAIVENGTVFSEKFLNEPYIHSEKLIPIIIEVLSNISEFDAVAISIGPGSFTGLRIGLSVAKGLAFASDKPIISVPTLKALAYNLLYNGKVVEGSRICSLLDGRKDEFYVALSLVEAGNVQTSEAAALKFENILRLLPNTTINFVGDGIYKFQKIAAERCVTDKLWIFYEGLINLCSAASVALLGEKKMLKNQTDNLIEIEPLYVKDFQTLVKTKHD